MKIYSYMFSGKPVLATRMATHTQVLSDDNAVLADPVPERFAGALCELLEDSRKRESIGLRAIRDVEERYSFKVYKEKLARIYGVIAQDLGINMEIYREMEQGGVTPVESAHHPEENS
jgi:glycosyltransferase involved in cell wall biosynthesis